MTTSRFSVIHDDTAPTGFVSIDRLMWIGTATISATRMLEEGNYQSAGLMLKHVNELIEKIIAQPTGGDAA